jgi:hypothetical protein
MMPTANELGEREEKGKRTGNGFAQATMKRMSYVFSLFF